MIILYLISYTQAIHHQMKHNIVMIVVSFVNRMLFIYYYHVIIIIIINYIHIFVNALDNNALNRAYIYTDNNIRVYIG